MTKSTSTNINLQQKFDKVPDYWHPYIIGELNENHVKIARVKGEFVWHKHDGEDELFVVVSGTLMMDFRDKTVTTHAGEIIIVPKGVEHRPWTRNDEEVRIMLVEPRQIRHTGDVTVAQTVTEQEWI